MCFLPQGLRKDGGKTVFEKSWERLTTGEKDTFRRLVNSLLGHTFLTAEQYDFEEGMTRINKDYLFVERHFELFREYLDYAGFMLRRDSGYGEIYLESQSDANRVKFDKLTTLMVYTLRLIYEEEREKLTLSREVFLTTGDLVHKMVSIGAIRKKPANIVLHESLRMLHHFRIVEKMDGPWENADTRLLILPVILFIVSNEQISNMHKLVEDEGFLSETDEKELSEAEEE